MAELQTLPSDDFVLPAANTTSTELIAPPTHNTDADADSTALAIADPTAAAATTTTEKKTKKIIRRKKLRPARPQVDPAAIKSEPPPQTGTIFNIWYNKWAGGDREDKYLSHTAAKSRCNIAKDAGYTRADHTAGGGGAGSSYFCLWFARGLCPKAQDCEYLHRLPGLHDLFSPNVDCFGRDKFSDYRDDMGGVGSFMRQNRTIYLGRIHVSDDIEEVVSRHMAEWGQIERTRVLNSRGVAFVTYSNEANAQFAREAMAHQALDHEEVLNVRWATADPNPMAKAREARKIEEQAAEAVRRALPEEFVAQIEGRDPESRKRRKIESNYGLEGYEAPDEVHFARGSNAVNPLGRIGYGNGELEDEQLLAIEDGSAAAQAEADDGTPAPEEENGIFSSSTIAAFNSAKVAVASKEKPASTGPLVAYDSDSD